MADNELTVEEIDAHRQVTNEAMPIMPEYRKRTNVLCHMARRCATEMPELKKDKRVLRNREVFLLEAAMKTADRIAELEAQVERMRTAISDAISAIDGHTQFCPGDSALDHAAPELEKALADLPDTSKAVEKIKSEVLQDLNVYVHRNDDPEEHQSQTWVWCLIHDFAKDRGIEMNWDLTND